MKSYQRLLIFVMLVLALTALISPWAATAWNLISGAEALAPEDRIPFSRFFDRFFMVSGILLFFSYRSLLKIDSLSQLGLSPRTRAASDVAIGRVPRPRIDVCLGFGYVSRRSVRALFSAVPRGIGGTVRKSDTHGFYGRVFRRDFLPGYYFSGTASGLEAFARLYHSESLLLRFAFRPAGGKIFSFGHGSLGWVPSSVFHIRAVFGTRRDCSGNHRSPAHRNRVELCLPSNRHAISSHRPPCRLGDQHQDSPCFRRLPNGKSGLVVWRQRSKIRQWRCNLGGYPSRWPRGPLAYPEPCGSPCHK